VRKRGARRGGWWWDGADCCRLDLILDRDNNGGRPLCSADAMNSGGSRNGIIEGNQLTRTHCVQQTPEVQKEKKKIK
jgi:hypothetical protein